MNVLYIVVCNDESHVNLPGGGGENGDNLLPYQLGDSCYERQLYIEG